MNQNRRHPTHRYRWQTLVMLCAFAIVVEFGTTAAPVNAQATSDDSPNGWHTGVDPNANPTANTTVIERQPASSPDINPKAGNATVKLVAFLTADGQQIDQGLVWHVFKFDKASGQSVLKKTIRAASPAVPLRNGNYIVNASFGRAHLTKEITVNTATPKKVEQFILNAGGLKINAQLENGKIAENAFKYDIYTDRDQLDDRKLVLGNAKPSLIVRLNAGIYHVVSTYGDANAKVRSDITVEAGKLTEVTITHSAAKVRFKLVARSGGEALPDTQWSVRTPQGDIIKQSVGALPIHILAPGSYSVVGVFEGQSYQRDFTLKDGQMVDVEVLRK